MGGPLAQQLPGPAQQPSRPGGAEPVAYLFAVSVCSLACLALPGGKEEGRRLEAGSLLGQGNRAGSLSSPFKLLELVTPLTGRNSHGVGGGGKDFFPRAALALGGPVSKHPT